MTRRKWAYTLVHDYLTGQYYGTRMTPGQVDGKYRLHLIEHPDSDQWGKSSLISCIAGKSFASAEELERFGSDLIVDEQLQQSGR